VILPPNPTLDVALPTKSNLKSQCPHRNVAFTMSLYKVSLCRFTWMETLRNVALQKTRILRFSDELVIGPFSNLKIQNGTCKLRPSSDGLRHVLDRSYVCTGNFFYGGSSRRVSKTKAGTSCPSKNCNYAANMRRGPGHGRRLQRRFILCFSAYVARTSERRVVC